MKPQLNYIPSKSNVLVNGNFLSAKGIMHFGLTRLNFCIANAIGLFKLAEPFSGIFLAVQN
jgi:hypothetical protein